MMRLILLLFLGLMPRAALAGEVTVAVASNFLATAEEIVAGFEEATGHEVTLTHGSTGQIYAQIAAGAPFDIFLSADDRRPKLLARGGLATDVRTYAIGRLVLVSRLPITRETAPEVFAGRTAALADPTVAPYGLAATAAMEGLSLDTATFQPVLVANVGQVAVIYTTGNTDLAFLSAAQLPLIEAPHVLDIDGLYPALVQDAALLQQSEGNQAAAAFWEWLFSEETKTLIGASGYDLPG
ncbi:MAG: molybdate ABC transporter substrate-binding protein [Silicimonas sp.]|nr:molybdate ABC transporter substrate-binding protein [Silicimonas sp.]